MRPKKEKVKVVCLRYTSYRGFGSFMCSGLNLHIITLLYRLDQCG